MKLLEENRTVLAQIAESGSDLRGRREVDFENVFPCEESAHTFAKLSKEAGYPPEVWLTEGEEWNVTVKVSMVPTAEAITEIELFLDQLARSMSGKVDGWGFFRTV